MSQKKLKQLKAVIKNYPAEKQEVENLHQVTKIGYWQILKENYKFLIFLTVGIFVVFINALNGDFVSDDYATIPHNPLVANLGVGFKGLVSSNIAKSMVAFLFGVKPFQYHLFNIIFFILICWVMFVAVYKFYNDKILTILTMLFFAVHPIHVEAVSWISGIVYLFIAFYTLLIILFLIKFLEGGGWKYLFFAGTVFLLAYLNDIPRIFAIFPLFLLYVVFNGSVKVRSKVWMILPYIVIILIVALFFGWSRIMNRINVVNSGYNLSESIFYNPFFQYPTGIAKYFQIFWAPFDLTLYHTMYVFPVWLNWSIIINLLTMIVYFFFKDKRIFFALSFIVIAILPSMAPVKVSWLVAERYGFLPSLGFCIFMAIIVIELWKKAKIVAPTLLISILIFFIVRTYMRNDDWSTNHKLWVNTCQVSPNSHNAWNNIGDDYDKLSDYENAIKGFTQSTIIKPNYADAYHNRANIFFKIGRLDLARESYNIALAYSPGLYQTYLSLIQIDLMEGNNNLALDHSKKLLSVQPENTQAWYAYGLVMSQMGNVDEATKALNTSLGYDPGNRMAAELLSRIRNSN